MRQILIIVLIAVTGCSTTNAPSTPGLEGKEKTPVNERDRQKSYSKNFIALGGINQ